MTTRTLVLVTFLCLGTPGLHVVAQPKPLPSTKIPTDKSAGSKAPSTGIPVPDYTIRGRDTLSLSGADKEPLPLKRDSMWTSVLSSGAVSPSSLAPFRRPRPTGVAESADRFLRLDGGLGSYSTPRIGLWYGDAFPTFDLMGSLRLEHSLGHVSDAEYTHVDAEIGGRGFLSRHAHPLLRGSAIEGSASLSTREYSLYGQNGNPYFPDLHFDRRMAGLTLQSRILSRNNSRADYQLGIMADFHTWKETMKDGWIGGTISSGSLDERRIGFLGTTQFALPDSWGLPVSHIHLDAVLRFHFGSPSLYADQRPFFSSITATSTHAISRALLFEGGLGITTARGSEQATAFRIYPRASVRYTGLDKDLVLLLEYEGGIRENSVAEMMKWNPYLMLGAPLLHEEFPAHIVAAAQYDDGDKLRGAAELDFRYVKNAAIPTLVPPPVHRQWTMIHSEEATIFTAKVNAARQHSLSDYSSAILLLRQSHNALTNGRLPYLPSFEASMSHRHTFAFGLSLQATLEVLGSRTASSGDLSSVILLSADAEYPIFNSVRVYVECDNLLDDSWYLWDGYRERPLFIMIGFRANL